MHSSTQTSTGPRPTVDKLIETLASAESLHYASALALGKIGYSWQSASNLLRPSSDEWFLIVQSKTIHRMGRQCAVARGSTYLAVSVQSRSRSFFLKTGFTRLEVFDLASSWQFLRGLWAPRDVGKPVAVCAV